MPKALVRHLKQRRQSSKYELVDQFTINNNTHKEPNAAWARSIVRDWFPQFVVTNRLVLLNRTKHGYYAIRACNPNADGFVWQYLYITEVK